MSTLHITNGDSAAGGIRALGIEGEVLPWRDVLHEGPVPAGLSLAELSLVRAGDLASKGMGDRAGIERDFAERDDVLRRFADNDEVVLWFEWDLFDQLQLIQLLDFFSRASVGSSTETGTRLALICIDGYLGNLPLDEFAPLFAGRATVTGTMLRSGSDAWAAFRSEDPRGIERIASAGARELRFLPGALTRHLEEFPALENGVSRSEAQILQAVAPGPLTFSEMFRRVANREERVFCGDRTMALYVERLSRAPLPLVMHPTGERIAAPRTSEDSRAFRNSDIALTDAGRGVLAGELDWISMGGSDRWLGGVHLAGATSRWRWDDASGKIRDMGSESAA